MCWGSLTYIAQIVLGFFCFFNPPPKKMGESFFVASIAIKYYNVCALQTLQHIDKQLSDAITYHFKCFSTQVLSVLLKSRTGQYNTLAL